MFHPFLHSLFISCSSINSLYVSYRIIMCAKYSCYIMSQPLVHEAITFTENHPDFQLEVAVYEFRVPK